MRTVWSLYGKTLRTLALRSPALQQDSQCDSRMSLSSNTLPVCRASFFFLAFFFFFFTFHCFCFLLLPFLPHFPLSSLFAFHVFSFCFPSFPFLSFFFPFPFKFCFSFLSPLLPFHFHCLSCHFFLFLFYLLFCPSVRELPDLQLTGFGEVGFLFLFVVFQICNQENKYSHKCWTDSVTQCGASLSYSSAPCLHWM